VIDKLRGVQGQSHEKSDRETTEKVLNERLKDDRNKHEVTLDDLEHDEAQRNVRIARSEGLLSDKGRNDWFRVD